MPTYIIKTINFGGCKFSVVRPTTGRVYPTTCDPLLQYGIINCKVENFINFGSLLFQHLIQLYQFFFPNKHIIRNQWGNLKKKNQRYIGKGRNLFRLYHSPREPIQNKSFFTWRFLHRLIDNSNHQIIRDKFSLHEQNKFNHTNNLPTKYATENAGTSAHDSNWMCRMKLKRKLPYPLLPLP